MNDNEPDDRMPASRPAYSCPWFDVFEEEPDELDPAAIAFSIIVPTRSSVVAVITDGADAILFVKLFRRTTGQQEWELPAGRIEGEETAAEAASREVAEESGVVMIEGREIGVIFPMNGMSSAKAHVFHGTVERRDTASREGEFECCWMTRREIEQLIAGRELRDGVSLAALMLYWARP